MNLNKIKLIAPDKTVILRPPALKDWRVKRPTCPPLAEESQSEILRSAQDDEVFLGSLSPRRGQRGFTLIELMIVIVIIAALAAFVVPRLTGRSEEALISACRADLKGNLSMALRLYEVDNGKYPTTQQGLQALIEKTGTPPVPRNWKGPYVEQQPLDPWGAAYQYAYPGTHPPRDYDVWSFGPDGIESADDVANWQP